jgi:hypothetical protein
MLLPANGFALLLPFASAGASDEAGRDSASRGVTMIELPGPGTRAGELATGESTRVREEKLLRRDMAAGVQDWVE